MPVNSNTMIPAQIQAPLFAALLFIVIASPVTFSFVNALVEPVLRLKVSQNGQPTRFGLILHAVVYFGLSFWFLKGK